MLKWWGDTDLKKFRRADVARVHNKVGRKTPYEANRMLTQLHHMLTKAEIWGYVPEGTPNPAKGVERFKEKSRTRWLEPAELRRFWEATGKIDQHMGALFRLLLLTGARKTEVLGAKWEQVKFDRQLLHLPITKQGRVHEIPLSDTAIEILNSLPRSTYNPHIFPGRGHDYRKNVKRFWKEVLELAEIDQLRIHDLRHTAGSMMASSGISLKIVGGVLGHSQSSTTERYAHLDNSALRGAINQHSEMVARLIQAGDDPHS